MNTTVRSVRLVWLAALAVAAAVAACDKEKTDDTVSVPSTPLSVQQIIVSPKAAAPLDTITLTADIRSSSPNSGDIPNTLWTATGGGFVLDKGLSVQWVAPSSPGIFTISVRATNGAGSTTGKTDVFVGSPSVLVASEAGAVRLMANRSDFYYLRTPDLTKGVEVFKYSGGVSADAVDPVQPTGLNLTYSPTLEFAVHARDQVDSLPVANPNPRPRHILIGDFGLRTLHRISKDLAGPTSLRRNVFNFPSVSPDGQLIAYQGLVTDETTAALDSMDIFVYKRTPPSRVRATKSHSSHRNFMPAFSPDGRWLTFFSDRSGLNRWEIYGMPVSGTTVDTDTARVRRLTNTGGTITGTGVNNTPLNNLRSWNPVTSTLAILNADNTVYLMTTNAGGASLVEVTGLPLSVQEFAWSPDGTRLAVVATGKVGDKSALQIYTVSGNSAQIRYQALPGDGCRDIAWSPDGLWMVFRVARGESAWLELMDLTGARLSKTVPLTRKFPSGSAGTYRAAMSLSPAWGAGDILYAPVFRGGLTPGIISLDVSNAVQ